MANTGSPNSRAGDSRRRSSITRGDLLTVAVAAMLCTASYSLSIWNSSRGKADSIVPGQVTVFVGETFCGGDSSADDVLDFVAHHTAEKAGLSVSTAATTPSERRALRGEAPMGTVPGEAPMGTGYRGPFPWPASRGVVWAGNSARGAEAADGKGWARVDGDKLRFTDAVAVRAYADAIFQLVPAPVRTALDVGAMHAGSWGAELLSRGVLAVSVAPWGASEDALVELALERGVPAMLAARAPSRQLPYPARAFDMAHCGRCLVPWHLHDGLFLMEMDRVLRPGGYWVHSGAPRNGTQERASIESAATSMCWRKVADQNGITVWQKPVSLIGCDDRETTTRSPRSIQKVAAPGEPTAETLTQDAETWKKRVAHYKAVVTQLGQKGRYRNLLDMNARLGGFAAALADDPVWVLNVIPAVASAASADTDTLGAIYDNGLVGAYHDWCERMPTPPMSYDLLHADSLFTLYRDRCGMEDILLEMDRILRPDRAVIIRDDIDVLVKIRAVTDRMRWDNQILDSENGTDEREKILLAVKPYWNDQDRDQDH